MPGLGISGQAGIALLVAAMMGAGDDDLGKELPRIAATEARDALATFRVRPGFELRLVAAEPLVTDPVDCAYDEDGKLYVVEMRGYPYPENTPPGRVKRLVDRDGDGVFEEAVTFLDGLSWPTSVVPYKGGVFIAEPPRLIYARDDDGDGVADTKKVVFTGFGTNNVQALFNSLTWGPDGWIYGNGSSNGGKIEAGGKPVVDLGIRDFRFSPGTGEFEPISGGGQFGMTFDAWGHRFTCNNSNHIRQVVLPAHYLARNPAFRAPGAILDIAAEGAAAPVFRVSGPEPWRLVRTRQRAADPAFREKAPATELVATGFFTSATGVTIYTGSAFPEECWGNAFIGDVGGNLVHRKRMEVDGSVYKASRADEGVEFLASTDNWFRPVNFENTPRGTLLVLDMYRETIEHPWSIPEPIKKHLDLTSGHDQGRLYEIVPVGFEGRAKPALGIASVRELVGTLADADGWWRDTARRLLIERGEKAESVPALRELARKRPNGLARLYALEVLATLGELSAEDLLPALADEEPRVRERAAVLAEGLAGNEKVGLALMGLSGDPDRMVRFQAAFSIGEVEGPGGVEALAEIAEESGGDPWTRAAVFSSLDGKAGEMLVDLAGKEGFLESEAGKGWLNGLAGLAGAAAKPEEAGELLRKFVGGEPESGRARTLALAMLEGHGNGGEGDWLAKGTGSREVLMPIFEEAARKLSGDGIDESVAVQCARLLGFAPAEVAVGPLAGRLSARNPTAVQIAALRGLGMQQGPEVAGEVLAAWRRLGPGVRREATEVMLARKDRALTLLGALEAGAVAAADLNPTRLRSLRESGDEELKTRAAEVLGRSATKADRQAIIDAYRPALGLKGGSEEGRAVFRRVCATCHKAEGFGSAVGPDLATVAGRTDEDLVLHILDPNREVLPQYVNYLVATTDGRSISGIVANESPGAITLRRAEGVEDVVPRDQIEEIASAGVSQMPEGLEKEVDAQAMADLIAFIKGLAGPK